MPEKMFAHSNYISAAAMETYRSHSTELMGYITAPATRKSGFGVYDFKIDCETYSAVCPMGKNSRITRLQKGGERIIYFDKADCMECPHFEACVNTKRHRAKQFTLVKYSNKYRNIEKPKKRRPLKTR